MKEIVTWIFGIILVSIAVLSLAWAFTGNDFFLYRYFAPKQESVRREVFKQSQAYQDGTVQDLQNLRLQYIQATDPNAKDALASVILQRSSTFYGEMPSDLRSFIDGIKNNRGLTQ
jgi:hypothetical protein